MAVDDALHEAGLLPTLRIYSWLRPTLSLGVLQRYREIPQALREAADQIVRRSTGGGAILHEPAELTFSLTMAITDAPALAPLRASYSILNHAIAAALEQCGVAVDARDAGARYGADRDFDCFKRATDLDLASGGQKIAGTSQRRSRGRLLAHTSIRNPPAALAATLPECLAALLCASLATGQLESSELALANELEATRHEHQDWIERR